MSMPIDLPPARRAWAGAVVLAASILAAAVATAAPVTGNSAGDGPAPVRPAIPAPALSDLIGTGRGTSSTDDAPLPEVHRDLASLPPAVASMRQKIIDAAMSGDMDRMRTVIGLSDPAPVLSSSGDSDDPIDALEAGGGTDAGLEVLAILIDVLDAGWVIKDEGTPRARYVWPYFAEFPPDRLTPAQMVDVYRVMTAGDFDQVRGGGGYSFYRAEIGADGRWLLFMNGE